MVGSACTRSKAEKITISHCSIILVTSNVSGLKTMAKYPVCLVYNVFFHYIIHIYKAREMTAALICILTLEEYETFLKTPI